MEAASWLKVAWLLFAVGILAATILQFLYCNEAVPFYSHWLQISFRVPIIIYMLWGAARYGDKREA
jgi:hypothetical protein